MTTLGAALYFGFFAAAALCLFLTADRPAEQEEPGEHPDAAAPGRVLVKSGCD